MRNKVLSIAVMIGLIAGEIYAQMPGQPSLPGVAAYATADATAAFRIKYNGSAATATISNTPLQMVVVDDTVSTTIVFTNTATYTAAGIKALIEACTNSAGAMNYKCEYWGMISTDIVSNRVVQQTNVNMADGKWHTDLLKIDTSTALEYDAVSYADSVPERWLSKIYGDPLGTGNVGLSVYIDSGSGYTQVYGKTITSPVYVPDSMASITNVTTAVNVVGVDESLAFGTVYGLRIPQNAKCLVRATRATTATTGGIGALLTFK